MTHELKTWTTYFHRVLTGEKKFELRYDDRDFQVGDTLHLKEWDNEKQIYTGREHMVTVTYILQGGQFGLEKGYVILSIVEYETTNP